MHLIKTQCVVGEDIADTTVSTTVDLSPPASKVLKIDASIRELNAEVVSDQVMISGTLHKQIFYVGPNNQVFHEGEDVSFSAFADVPGAAPGMNAQVHPAIIDVDWKLKSPTLLEQTVVLQFFVKVTETCQLSFVEDEQGPLVKTEVVVIEDTTGVVVEDEVDLDRPAQKIRNINVTINRDELTATAMQDQVEVEGTMTKTILFVGLDDNEFFQEVVIPFSKVAQLPGVEPGMSVQVDAVIERVTWSMVDSDTITERVVLVLFIKVSEDAQLNLALDPDGPLVKLEQVVGENSKQLLLENTICIKRGAKKIDDIEARITDITTDVLPGKVVIQGILHKQIFFVGSSDRVRHMPEDIEFSLFIEVPEAEPGMNVEVFPAIEFLTWDLVKETPECPGPYDDMLNEDDNLKFVLKQKTIIAFFVKVGEFVQLNIRTEPDPDGPPMG